MGSELNATLGSMLLHDKCPNAQIKRLNQPKKLNAVSTKVIFSSLPFASLVFTL
jgi:hypothetical protein